MPNDTSKSLVLVSKQNGLVVIPAETPLTRLNYFDGKFLRASDLKAEQDYLRQLVRQSNQAGGSGVVHGFDVKLGGGDTIEIGPGLAIDPEGRVLLLPQGTLISVQELIDKSLDLQGIYGKSDAKSEFETCEQTTETPPDSVTHPNNLYVIVISAAEALCGEEDVYGKLCEEACATTTDRPLAVEGLIVRAVSLGLKTPLPDSKAVSITTQTHYRSRVASAYFEDERNRVAHLISAQGLKQQTWCLGADAAADGGVAIGVFARAGSTTLFLDPWIVRRELIDTPARRYWQWRMMMRPWDVFLAQVLQFQCQLHELYKKLPDPGVGVDPCSGARDALKEAADTIAELKKFYEETTQQFTYLNLDKDKAVTLPGGWSALDDLKNKLMNVGQGFTVLPANQWLINGGIVELPSAGYLPVVPGTETTINQQVRKMMGEGVDLRFCVVRPDYVAHALEEAQHLERISLTAGLDDPQQKPQVDILVPNGQIIEDKAVVRDAFEASVKILPAYVDDLMWAFLETGRIYNLNLPENLDVTLDFNGAARHEAQAGGGHKFYAAMLLDDSFLQGMVRSFLAAQLSGGKTASAETKAKSKSADNKDEAGLRSSAIFSHFKTAAAKRREEAQPAGAKRKIEATATVRAKAPTPQPAQSTYYVAPTPTDLKLPAGLWLTISCDQDPRKAEPNQLLNVYGRVIIGAQIPAPLNVPAYLDVALNLDPPAFVTDAGTNPDGSHFLKCDVTASGSIRTRWGNNKPSPDRRDVHLNVEVTWGPAAGGSGSNVEIKMTESESEITVKFNGKWGGSSPDIAGNVSSGSNQDFEVGLHPNADVLKESNEKHMRAIQALQVIGSSLNSPYFFSATSVQLFPPPPKPTDELIVRGTQDWVMFHRRRNKNCATATVAPAPRRYRVYQFAETPEILKQFDIRAEDVVPKAPLTKEQILKVSSQLLQVFKQIGEVGFGGGVATFVGDISSVKNAWQKIPGGKILWGAIGSRGDAMTDGESLSVGRLRTLESALDQVSPNARADVLPIVPPPLASPDVDGVILLITGGDEPVPSADLAITKFDSPDPVTPGNNITYVLQVNNSGPTAATDVTVTDLVPGETVFVSASVLSGTGWTPTTPAVGSMGAVLFKKASVAAGETATFQIVVKVNPTLSSAMTITNTATVLSPTADPNPANNSATTTTTVTPPASADLRITKTALSSKDAAGLPIIVYTLTATNAGPSPAQTVTVTDAVPANTTFASARILSGSGWIQANPSVGGTGNVTFKKPSVAVAETASFEIIVKVNPGLPTSLITNTATIGSPTADPSAPNNTATATTGVTPPQPLNADLRMIKTAAPTSVAPGGTITYTLEVTNLGPSTAQTVTVTDAIPGNTTFFSATAPTGWTPSTPLFGNTGTVTFTKSSVAAGEPASFQIVVRVNQNVTATTITNSATVGSTTPDLLMSNNTDAEVTTVLPPPPSNIRTALLLPVDFRSGTARFVITQLPHTTKVSFTNNIPQTGVLDSAFKDLLILPDARFGKITMADVIAPLDPAINDRLNAVVNIFKAAGGGDPDTLAMVLNSADNSALLSAGINLAGVDEIIYLEIGVVG